MFELRCGFELCSVVVIGWFGCVVCVFGLMVVVLVFMLRSRVFNLFVFVG